VHSDRLSALATCSPGLLVSWPPGRARTAFVGKCTIARRSRGVQSQRRPELLHSPQAGPLSLTWPCLAMAATPSSNPPHRESATPRSIGLSHVRLVNSSNRDAVRQLTSRNQHVLMANVNMATVAGSASELYYATATELAQRIRDRDISSVEVIDAFLARIGAHNGTLNAIVLLFEAEARSRAREADEALARGQIWGPLHGVPVTIKEMFLIANTTSTLNSKRLKHFVASEDGVLVKRIKAAGAVIFGKTNVPAKLQGYQCKGDIYPEAKNPYRLECSPGGSTGGGAAAVADRMTALELRADGRGSLRVPAHFCGVFCLKPTDKTVVRHGGCPCPIRRTAGW
jgi:Amidase